MDNNTVSDKPIDSFRLRVLMPYLASLLVMIVVIILFAKTIRDSSFDDRARLAREELRRSYQQALVDDAELIKGAMFFLQTDKVLIGAWQKRDRKRLQHHAKRLFTDLKARFRITHFYLHDTEGVNVLRVHQPGRFGDRIKRVTMQRAIRSGKTVAGIEFGPLGHFVLRVVSPWRINGRLMGYVELGEEIDHVITKLAKIYGYELFFLVDRHVLERSRLAKTEAIQKKLQQASRFRNALLVNQTSKIVPPELVALGDHMSHGHSQQYRVYQFNGKTYFGSTIELRDAADLHVGHIVFQADISAYVAEQRSLFTWGVGMLVVLVLLLAVLSIPYLHRMRRWLHSIYGRLDDEIRERKEAQERLERYSDELEIRVEERTGDLIRLNKQLEADIRARKLAEDALRGSEEKYRTLFERSADALMIVDNGSFSDCNAAAVSMFRVDTKQQLLDMHPSEISPEYQSDGKSSRQKADEMMDIALRQGGNRFEWDHKRSDGEVFPAEVLLTPVAVGDRQVLHAVVRDITERKEAEKQIEHFAFFDSLTGLPNRHLFMDRLQQAVSHCLRHGGQGAVLYLDLDQFKTINDSLGHSVGDALLKEVSGRLLQCLRDEDTAARLGGDEFVILLTSSRGDSNMAVAKRAEMVAERVRDSLRKSFRVEDYELNISTSIGISIFPDQSSDIDDLLRQADTAMYKAKEEGRDTIRFYMPAMQKAAMKRLHMERDLRAAIDNNELYIEYQPQYDADERITGVEALLRWNHPERGFVSPAEFIPLAEETGLIMRIGDWVLHRSIEDILPFRSHGPGEAPLRLSVNVSARQFGEKDFLDKIAALVDENALPNDFLMLEITETVAMDDIEGNIQRFKQLKSMGLMISLDDFGTGHSSLSYLKRLPLDELKIDRSFVMDIETDTNDAILVDTIISMSGHLDIDVIAEGVETEAQRAFLAERGCERYQGFHFCRPVSLDKLRQLIIGQSGLKAIPGKGGDVA